VLRTEISFRERRGRAWLRILLGSSGVGAVLVAIIRLYSGSHHDPPQPQVIVPVNVTVQNQMPAPIQLPPTQPDVAKQVAPPVGSQLDSVLLRFYATSKNVPIAAQEIDAQSGEPITFHWNLDGINLDKAGVKDVVFLTCGNQVFPVKLKGEVPLTFTSDTRCELNGPNTVPMHYPIFGEKSLGHTSFGGIKISIR